MVASKEQQEEFRTRNGVDLDFTIKAEDYTWKVHSTLIAEASPMLRVACYGSFKEQQERMIELPEDCPTVVSRALQWIYQGDYSLEPYDDFGTEYGHDWTVLNLLEKGFRMPELLNGDAEAVRKLVNMDYDRDGLEILALVYCFAEKFGMVGLQLKVCSNIAKTYHQDLVDMGRAYCSESYWKFHDFLPQHLVETDGLLRRELAYLARYTFDENGRLNDERMQDLLENDKEFAVMLRERLVARNHRLEQELGYVTDKAKVERRLLTKIKKLLAEVENLQVLIGVDD